MADALERVTNLLALLLETRRPLTMEQIADRLGAYSTTSIVAARGAFERDKAVLRDVGVPIETEVLVGDQAGKTGYRIDRDRYELAGLSLTTEERQALQLAVAAIRSGDASFGLLKLGGSLAGDAPVVTNVPALDVLPICAKPRPAGRRWSSTTAASTGSSSRTYCCSARASGTSSGSTGPRRAAHVPRRPDRGRGRRRRGRRLRAAAGLRRPRTRSPRTPRSSATRPQRRGCWSTPSGRASWSTSSGRGRSSPGARDGSVELDVACANLDAFRSWVLGLGDHAEVLGPPEVRAAIVDWLRSMAEHRGFVTRRGRGRARSAIACAACW